MIIIIFNFTRKKTNKWMTCHVKGLTYVENKPDFYLHLAALAISCVVDKSMKILDENNIIKYVIGDMCLIEIL